MRTLDGPELGHDQVGTDVVETPRANGSQVMHADHAVAHSLRQHLGKRLQQLGILFVEQPTGGAAHEPPTSEQQPDGHQAGGHRIEPDEPCKAHQQ